MPQPMKKPRFDLVDVLAGVVLAMLITIASAGLMLARMAV